MLPYKGTVNLQGENYVLGSKLLSAGAFLRDDYIHGVPFP